ESSTKPSGRVKLNSVCSPRIRVLSGFGELLDALQTFVNDGDRFDGHVVATRIERWASMFRDPTIGEVPAQHLSILVVVDDDRAGFAGAGEVPVDGFLAPIVKVHAALGEAAFQLNVCPLHGAGKFADNALALQPGLFRLDDRGLVVETRALAEGGL